MFTFDADGTAAVRHLKSFTVGTAEDCELRYDDEYMSAHHARVYEDEWGSVWVEDLGSTNGTFVNGIKVWGATRVRPGYVVRCGKTLLPWKA